MHSFQTVIIDEAHHIVSDVSEQILYFLLHQNSFVKCGQDGDFVKHGQMPFAIYLTATPEQAVYPQLLAAWAGPPSYVGTTARLHGATVYSCVSPLPAIAPIWCEKRPDQINFSAMKTMLYGQEKRHKWLISTVLLPLVQQHSRRVLYCTEAVDAIHALAALLGDETAGTFCESDSPAKLANVVQRPIVLTSYAKASEALDLPEGPNTVVLDVTTTLLKQTAGRVFRGDSASNTWVVLVGDDGPCFTRQHAERVRYCQTVLGWTVVPVTNLTTLTFLKRTQKRKHDDAHENGSENGSENENDAHEKDCEKDCENEDGARGKDGVKNEKDQKSVRPKCMRRSRTTIEQQNGS